MTGFPAKEWSQLHDRGGFYATNIVYREELLVRYRAHPWLLDVPIRGAPVTSHLLAWLESLLRGLVATGLGTRDNLGCEVLLDGYARSIASLTRDISVSAAQPVQSAAVTEFLLPRLQDGFPILASMLTQEQY